ncbi:MAG: tRNA uridine-5-carboxymethylaminomethyl(34) synthesis GTPase MnmE [Trueperaceae bacterium]|nr:tRNA uridine-5-carboxymethylaminomethyl(34) synthesis GTPase MnmE [Trueperaceae bacterium]
MPLPPPGDTITAIATAPGEGAIGVVRVSGPDAYAVADAVFVPASGERPSRLPARRVAFGRVQDQGETVDQGLLLTFRAPHSYTGQDAVEVQTHGGAAVLRRVLDACLRAGARAAGPGEFTLRAYLNGKMDLVQAESVLAVVRARTDRARRTAAAGLTRRLSDELTSLQDRLTAAYGDLTAVLDYPEEGVELRDPRPALAQVRSRIAELLATAEAGRLAERGARLALVGRPNVGKSSLLNALLGFERSIVSASPGTTRDYLEAPLELEGVPLTAVDTAGVRDASDEIEASGVQRALTLAESADLVLCLLDLSQPLEPADRALLDRLGQARTLVIASKADLPAAWSPEEAHPRTIPISATRGDGLDVLRGRIRDALLGDAAGTELWISNERHADALRRTEALLARAADAPDDLMALDLQEALEVLAGLTGRGEIAEDTLAHVFENFCVGK